MIFKAHCTCYLGRLCMTTHKSWEEFERDKDPEIDRGLEEIRERLAAVGFDARAGPGSSYEKMKRKEA